MKPIIIALVGLLLILQYELWLSKGGINTIISLKQSNAALVATNKQLKDRNKALLADIKDLKSGNQAIEERARNELGMVKKGEIFYQVVKN